MIYEVEIFFRSLRRDGIKGVSMRLGQYFRQRVLGHESVPVPRSANLPQTRSGNQLEGERQGRLRITFHVSSLTPSNSGPPAQEPETAAAVVGHRSSPLGLAVPYLGGMEIGPSHREARDGHRLASQRLSGFSGSEEGRRLTGEH